MRPRTVASAALPNSDYYLRPHCSKFEEALETNSLAEWKKSICMLHCEVAPRVALYASKARRGDQKMNERFVPIFAFYHRFVILELDKLDRQRLILTLRHRVLDRPGPAC